MHIRSLRIKNFRALAEIEIEFAEGVNVIVGPNAIGKTSILEGIRLAKAILAPRTINEPTQALIGLGAVAPHDPNTLIFEAISRDHNVPIEIASTYELRPSEINEIETNLAEIATNLVKATLGQRFSNPTLLITYLASKEGKAAQADAESQLRDSLAQLRAGHDIGQLNVAIQPNGQFENPDRLFPMFFAFLESRLSPQLTRFSYFPADRALPLGEVPLQLGSADAAVQIESHNSQPQTKYARLKNTIFNAIVAGKEEHEQLDREFRKIFDGILKGKTITRIGTNRFGMLQVLVQDTETMKEFTIDALSSGEKGLILTFLLIARTLSPGGLILLDEPELHLNPAVCRSLLAFLFDNYIQPNDLQAVMCSHSPEILASVFDKDGCTLYHLIEPDLITRVRQSDRDVVAGALNKLGTTVSDELLFKATIFVEGQEDVEILETGFSDVLRRYKLKDLGGRPEVEKHIQELQDAEKKGTRFAPKYFIFDLDEKKTHLRDSGLVKILQWQRRTLENYLLDVDSLADLLRDRDVIAEPLANEGEVIRLLKQLAIAQLNDRVIRRTYDAYHFENLGIRPREVENLDFPSAADQLFERIGTTKQQIAHLEQQVWKQEFINACEATRHELASSWEANWKDDCDAKKLFEDLYKRRQFRISPLKLKKRVIEKMRSQNTANWQSLRRILTEFLGV